MGGSSDGWALLVGDEVLGADLPPATAAALRRLRAASGLDLFEVRLDTSPADGPVFAEVPFLARLHRYGDDAVAAVQDALVRRGREQA